MSDAVSDQITVHAPARTVLDVITDYERYPEWQAEVLEVEILERGDDGRPTLVRFRIDAKIFTAGYVLRYDYEDGAVRWQLAESQQLRALDGAYELSEQNGHSTEVRYRLEVVPAVRIPGMLRRQAARRIVDGALRGLKRRVESMT